MPFEAVEIRSTRNGATSVDGYRQDLIAGDLVTLTLSDITSVTSYRWEMVGRPEGSAAGGSGPEPVQMGTASSASFTVDSDAPFRRDGNYHARCTINGGSPSETRIDVALIRVSGLALADGRVLRKIGGFESMEDTSAATIVQGWATMINRWLEALRSAISSGIPSGQTLNQTYATGAVAADQTLGLLDADGGTFTVDGSLAGFTGTNSFRVLGPSGLVALVVERTGNVGIGGAPASGITLHVQGSSASSVHGRVDNANGAGAAIQSVRALTSGSSQLQMVGWGPTHAASLTYDVADSGTLRSETAGGLSLAALAASAPVRVYTQVGGITTESVRVNASGALSMTAGALALAATDGFFFLRSMAGTPIGNADPNTPAGSAPILIDTTGNLVWFRSNSTWRSLVSSAGAAFTPGSVIFAGATGALAEDNAGFFWNDSVDQLFVTGAVAPQVRVNNTDTTVGTIFYSARVAGTSYGTLDAYGVNHVQTGGIDVPNSFVVAGRRAGGLALWASGNIRFHLAGAGDLEYGRWDLPGTEANFLIGSPTAAALGPTAGQGLLFLRQFNAPPSTAPVGGYTDKSPISVDASTNNFVYYSGGAWRTLVPTGAGAFTAGSVIFAGSTGALAQDNANFFWNDANNALGIGAAPPVGRDFYIAKEAPSVAIVSTASSDVAFQLSSGSFSTGIEQNAAGLFRIFAGNASTLQLDEVVSLSSEHSALSFSPEAMIVTGSYATQRNVLFAAPTYNGAFTLSDAATVAIVGPPTGTATITNPYALWLQGGNLRVGGNVGIGTAPGANNHLHILATTPFVLIQSSSGAGGLEFTNPANTDAGFSLNSAALFDMFVAGGGTFSIDGKLNLAAENNTFKIAPDARTISGSYATQRNFLFNGPVYNGAFTLDQAATVAIAAAPSGTATITEKLSLWSQAGSIRMDSLTTESNHIYDSNSFTNAWVINYKLSGSETGNFTWSTTALTLSGSEDVVIDFAPDGGAAAVRVGLGGSLEMVGGVLNSASTTGFFYLRSSSSALQIAAPVAVTGAVAFVVDDFDRFLYVHKGTTIWAPVSKLEPAQILNTSVILDDDDGTLIHTSATSHTYTLPAATGRAGRVLTIANRTGGGTVTIGRTDGDTINGADEDQTLAANASADLVATSGNWEMLR